MYDHNGLELTPATDTMNAYRRTAVDLTAKRFTAYASAKARFKDDWTMYKIGLYKDPRDAAYVAQQFEKIYDREKCRQLVTDGLFEEVAREFRETIEIPEWQYPAEGFSIEELLNGGYEEYKMNYVDNARDALREAIKVYNKPAPALSVAKVMINKVEELYKKGMTYRLAAKQIVEAI